MYISPPPIFQKLCYQKVGSIGVVVLHKKLFEPLKSIVATKSRPRQVPEAFAGLRHPYEGVRPTLNSRLVPVYGLAAPLQKALNQLSQILIIFWTSGHFRSHEYGKTTRRSTGFDATLQSFKIRHCLPILFYRFDLFPFTRIDYVNIFHKIRMLLYEFRQYLCLLYA